MEFSYLDQVYFAKIALIILDKNTKDNKTLSHLLEVGEIINANVGRQNATIYNITEYIYEQIRMNDGDSRAFEDVEQRKSLEAEIRDAGI